MELRAERITQLNCGRCGSAIDASRLRSLSTTECPSCGTKILVPASFGDLLLTGVLGRGSAGVVCKALDNRLHRQVAVKILSSSLTDNPLVEACKSEARAIARLNHPNVVQVHEIGQFKDQPFIVMELLDGGSIKDKMLGREVSQSEALGVAIQVAEGLKAAHEVGVIHLDVKPANILFSRHGTAKLIDFGAAMLAHQTGHDLGTPYYVAPEIALKQKPDLRADIYSLGATLFQLLSGQVPFDGPDVKTVIKARLTGPPPDLRSLREDIHPLVAHVVGRMLERDPDMRYGDYAELIADLQEARAAAERPAPRPASPQSPRGAAPAGKTKKRKPNQRLLPIMAVMLLLILAMAALIGWGVWKSLQPAELPPETAVAATVEPSAPAPAEVPIPEPVTTPPTPPTTPTTPTAPKPPTPTPTPAAPAKAPTPMVRLTPLLSVNANVPQTKGWMMLDVRSIAHVDSGFEKLDDGSIRMTAPPRGPLLITLIGNTWVSRVTAVRLDLMKDESLPSGGPGWGEKGAFRFTRVQLARYGTREPLAIASVRAVGPGIGTPGKLPAGKGPWGGRGEASTLIFTLAKPAPWTPKIAMLVRLSQDEAVGRFRVSVTGNPQPERLMSEPELPRAGR